MSEERASVRAFLRACERFESVGEACERDV